MFDRLEATINRGSLINQGHGCPALYDAIAVVVLSEHEAAVVNVIHLDAVRALLEGDLDARKREQVWSLASTDRLRKSTEVWGKHAARRL